MQAIFLNLNNVPKQVENTQMSKFHSTLEAHLQTLSPPLKFYNLQFMCGLPSGLFSNWKSGKRRPSDNDLKKIAAVKELGLTLEELKAWRALDKDGEKVIEVQAKEWIRQNPEEAEELLKEAKKIRRSLK